jgi:hypothetical protein
MPGSLDVHRFRSGLVLLLSGLLLVNQRLFPTENRVFSAQIAKAIDILEERDFDLSAGLPFAAPILSLALRFEREPRLDFRRPLQTLEAENRATRC